MPHAYDTVFVTLQRKLVSLLQNRSLFFKVPNKIKILISIFLGRKNTFSALQNSGSGTSRVHTLGETARDGSGLHSSARQQAVSPTCARARGRADCGRGCMCLRFFRSAARTSWFPRRPERRIARPSISPPVFPIADTTLFPIADPTLPFPHPSVFDIITGRDGGPPG